jgi:protein-tyrosine phosphatase
MNVKLLVFFIITQLYAVQNPVTIDLIIPANGSVTPDTRSSSDPLISHTQDSSIPSPTHFSWSVRGNTTSMAFDFFLSEDSLFGASDFSKKDITDTFLLVWNLKIDTRYFWKVSARDGQNALGESAIGFFTTNPAWPRMIYIDGATNIRDIGGRKTADGFLIRQGILYRSSEFNRTYTITEKGIEQLKQLHIACDIDLRRKDENPGPALSESVRYVNTVDSLGAGILQYKEGLISTGAIYAIVFKALADQRNYPGVFHCYAGADRTGTVAALLEAILGCSEKQMGEDYQWTSLSTHGVKDTISDNWKGTVSYLKSFDEKDSTVQAGACYYLLKQGLTIDDIISIRKIFIGDDRIPFYVSVKNPSRRSIASRKFKMIDRLLCSSPGLIPSIKKGTRKAVLFNCQGKKIAELNGPDFYAQAKAKLFNVRPGAYVILYK